MRIKKKVREKVYGDGAHDEIIRDQEKYYVFVQVARRECFNLVIQVHWLQNLILWYKAIHAAIRTLSVMAFTV